MMGRLWVSRREGCKEWSEGTIGAWDTCERIGGRGKSFEGASGQSRRGLWVGRRHKELREWAKMKEGFRVHDISLGGLVKCQWNNKVLKLFVCKGNKMCFVI